MVVISTTVSTSDGNLALTFKTFPWAPEKNGKRKQQSLGTKKKLVLTLNESDEQTITRKIKKKLFSSFLVFPGLEWGVVGEAPRGGGGGTPLPKKNSETGSLSQRLP